MVPSRKHISLFLRPIQSALRASLGETGATRYTQTSYPALADLIGAWFHEDYDIEGEGAPEIIAARAVHDSSRTDASECGNNMPALDG